MARTFARALGAVALVIACSALAQDSALQEKVGAIKQSLAESKQQLSRYQWSETTQLKLNGDEKPPTQNLCRYGPDGQVQKTPFGAPPPSPSGGRFKQRVIANKKAELKDYMGDVKGVLSMYVPPDPQRIEQARQAGKIALNPAAGVLNLVFHDYAQPGDQMTLTFDTAARKVVSLNVDTYMGDAKDKVTLQVQMASLPDGTNHVQQTSSERYRQKAGGDDDEFKLPKAAVTAALKKARRGGNLATDRSLNRSRRSLRRSLMLSIGSLADL